MSVVSEGWQPNLFQPGPPPGANNRRFALRGSFLCSTIANLRGIETHKENAEFFAILQGRDAAFDGLLQGIYCYVPEGSQHSQDDSDSWVIANDGRSAWQKLT